MSEEIVSRLRRLSDVRTDDADRVAKLKQFIANVCRAGLPPPLDDTQRALYVERPFAGDVAPDVAVKAPVLLVLKSPRFIYPELEEKPDGFSVASASRSRFGIRCPIPRSRVAARGSYKRRSRSGAGRAHGAGSRTKAKVEDFFTTGSPCRKRRT
jgi:hypothetical protein